MKRLTNVSGAIKEKRIYLNIRVHKISDFQNSRVILKRIDPTRTKTRLTYELQYNSSVGFCQILGATLRSEPSTVTMTYYYLSTTFQFSICLQGAVSVMENSKASRKNEFLLPGFFRRCIKFGAVFQEMR